LQGAVERLRRKRDEMTDSLSKRELTYTPF
jgi:hypothetical protein